MRAETKEQFREEHHFNPKMLLAGFTDSGKSSGQLWEFDAETGSKQRKHPTGVAKRNNYYTVQIDGVASDIYERRFSEIESMAAPIVQRIRLSGVLPGGTDYMGLMIFLALLYVRGPFWRANVNGSAESLARLMLRAQTSSKDLWTRMDEAMQRDGLPPMPVDYETMKDYVDSGVPILDHDSSDYHVETLVEAMDWMPDELAKRYWCVIQPVSDIDFIIGDDPFTLVWTDRSIPAFRSPGLATLKTELVVPLGSRVALLSRLEPTPEALNLPTNIVAELNRRTADQATRRVFARTNEFRWATEDGLIQSAGEWFAYRRHRGGADHLE